MNRTVKGFISAILTLSILLCSVLPIFAADEEEYLCELRLIYAEDYAEAKEILADKTSSDTDIRLAEARLKRSLIRQSVAAYKPR